MTSIPLFVAGHETTVNLIGNGLLALLNHPDQLAELRADHALLPGAVEQLLRYDSSVQRTGRITTTDIELDGRMISKGSLVVTRARCGEPRPCALSRSAWHGDLLRVACPCGVVFERWVTPEEADADLLRLARLN